MVDFDTLLQLLHHREASELRIEPGGSPQLIVANRASRLAYPAASPSWLRETAASLMGDDRWQAFADGDRLEFSYRVVGLAAFDLVVSGTPTAPRIIVRPQIDQAGLTIQPDSMLASPEAGLQAPRELRETLAAAVKAGASDVHLGDGDPPMMRVHGSLVPLAGAATQGRPIRPLVEQMLTPMGRRRLGDGAAVDFSFSIEDVGRFRANIYRAFKGYNVAIRSLPEKVPTLQDLRLPRSLSELVDVRDGLVLFTGATGSGKSATMAALVQHLNHTRPVHIITLEDPIEFVHPRSKAVIRQREVGVHVSSFAEGLRDALREDPDVILVGEMRDQETIALAITAAETGHLVLSTLHSNRAASAVARMVDVFPEHRHAQVRVQLSESLRAVVAQRLLPQADGKGRIAAVEVLRVNNAVGTHIRDQRMNQVSSVMQTHREEGMWVLERHLAALVKKGLISETTGQAHATDVSIFETYLRA